MAVYARTCSPINKFIVFRCTQPCLSHTCYTSYSYTNIIGAQTICISPRYTQELIILSYSLGTNLHKPCTYIHLHTWVLFVSHSQTNIGLCMGTVCLTYTHRYSLLPIHKQTQVCSRVLSASPTHIGTLCFLFTNKSTDLLSLSHSHPHTHPQILSRHSRLHSHSFKGLLRNVYCCISVNIFLKLSCLNLISKH